MVIRPDSDTCEGFKPYDLWLRFNRFPRKNYSHWRFPNGNGPNRHRFRHCSACDNKKPWCYMGCHRSTNKLAHFIPIKTTISLEQVVNLYDREVIRLHGVPKSFVSDRDARFTSKFWRSVQRALGTKLNFSTAFHPQTDGQSERTIQTLEDMLRACVLDLGGSWS